MGAVETWASVLVNRNQGFSNANSNISNEMVDQVCKIGVKSYKSPWSYLLTILYLILVYRTYCRIGRHRIIFLVIFLLAYSTSIYDMVYKIITPRHKLMKECRQEVTGKKSNAVKTAIYLISGIVLFILFFPIVYYGFFSLFMDMENSCRESRGRNNNRKNNNRRNNNRRNNNRN